MGASSSKNFSLENLPDQAGKIILITGGNIGIGLAAAEAFVSKSPKKLIIAGRSEDKIAAAKELLSKKYPNVDVVGLIVDLSSFKSIEKFEQMLSTEVDHIDILINNAGVYIPSFSKTEQNFEVTLGTNVFGTAYLTKILMPLVLKSPSARIVILSSGFVNMVSETMFEKYIKDIGGENLKETNLEVYAVSKILNAMYAYELQNRYKQSNVVVTSVHPGFVLSDIQNKTNKDLWVTNFFDGLAVWFAKSTAEGALPVLYCATSPDFDNFPEFHGKMFSDGPNVQLFKMPRVFTPTNCSRAYEEIERVIMEKISIS